MRSSPYGRSKGREIVHVVEAEVCGPSSLSLTFDDGSRKRVNLREFLGGGVFEPLLDPVYFAQVVVDHDAGTIVWPNGADIAPETLYELPEERVETGGRQAP